jgi:spore coat protein CotH
MELASCSADAAKPKTNGENVSSANLCSSYDPALSTANSDQLFAATMIPTFDLFLPQADWENLKRNARDEQYVPAEACYQGNRLGTVGLRFKGFYGSLYYCFDSKGDLICPRLSMKIKFDEYVDEQRFFGLKRLNFNAYQYDDSRMKEKLAYDLFRAMDIVAPRSAWAVVRVNGESQGLYGMVEAVDGRFTKNRWPQNPDGNLYKELWPTHATEGQIKNALETNEEIADISAYRSFTEAINSADDANLRTTLANYMDLDYFARFMAVEDALVSYDGISYFWTEKTETNNHNYYIYEESPSRFTLIPWDTETTFWINPTHAAPHWTVVPKDCNLTYSYWSGLARAAGCDRVFLALIADLSGWRAAARTLLDGPFTEQAMTAAINRYTQLIAAAVVADPTPHKYSTFEVAVAGLVSSIPAQRARLEKLIAR